MNSKQVCTFIWVINNPTKQDNLDQNLTFLFHLHFNDPKTMVNSSFHVNTNASSEFLLSIHSDKNYSTSFSLISMLSNKTVMLNGTKFEMKLSYMKCQYIMNFLTNLELMVVKETIEDKYPLCIEMQPRKITEQFGYIVSPG